MVNKAECLLDKEYYNICTYIDCQFYLLTYNVINCLLHYVVFCKFVAERVSE